MNLTDGYWELYERNDRCVQPWERRTFYLHGVGVPNDRRYLRSDHLDVIEVGHRVTGAIERENHTYLDARNGQLDRVLTRAVLGRESWRYQHSSEFD